MTPTLPEIASVPRSLIEHDIPTSGIAYYALLTSYPDAMPRELAKVIGITAMHARRLENKLIEIGAIAIQNKRSKRGTRRCIIPPFAADRAAS
ncbi:MAG: hypothetical protein ACYDA1_03675 [Vulcanimicrobiaceae bacterium]